MIVTIERDALHSALLIVAGRPRAGVINEILKHILLVTEPEKLRLSAHGLECYSEAEVAADVIQSGTRAVPTETFARLIGSLPHGSQLRLRLDDRERMEIICGRSTYRLPSLASDAFSPPLELRDPVTVTVDRKAIHRLFEMPRPMAEPKNPKFFYKGVNLHVASNGKLSSVASDGFRFMRVCSDISMPPETPAVIIPKDAIDEIRRVAEDGGEMAWSEQLFSVSAKGRRFVTKLIDGTFPDYQNLPRASETYIGVDHGLLLGVLRRLDLLSEEYSDATVSWDENPGELTVELTGRGFGVETLPCDGQNMPAGSFSVPPQQLASLLAALEAEIIQIVFTGPSAPIRIMVPNDPDLIAVQVPCAPRLARASAAA